MKRKPVLEACVETYEQALHAVQQGADRIELCSHLETGGLTPEPALVRKIIQTLSIPVMAMVRPRAGHFIYSEHELAEMSETIEMFRKEGVQGVVLGVLTATNEIDLASTALLASRATPLEVTFHKAIDLTADPVASARLLAGIPGITRILTSGGAETALEGQEVIRRMIQVTKGRLQILAAGKVTFDNLDQVHAAIGSSEYHGRKIV